MIGDADLELVIDFADARSFKTRWDGDILAPEFDGARPRCTSGRWPWPLVIVENSRWIASDELTVSRDLGNSIFEKPWQHFNVLSLERSVDIIARGAITARWEPRATTH